MHSRLKMLVAAAAVVTIGAALVVPVSADVTSDVDHTWSHLKGKAQGLFYTKGQSNARYHGALPPGKTMVGDWGVIEDNNLAAWHVESYPQRLPANVVPHYISTSTGSSPNCPGSVANPKARRGHLCVYEGFTNGNFAAHTGPATRFCFFRGVQSSTACQTVTDRFGFGLSIFPADSTEQFFGGGTWAVTASRTGPTITSARALGTLSKR